MTNLANWSLPLLLVSSGAVASPVPKALVLDLQRQDLESLGKGLEDVFGRAPVKGRYDQPLQNDYWWGTVRVEGISYQFNLANIRVSPESGRLRVDLDVANLVSNIERISFNESGSMHCRNVPLDTLGADVPVGSDLVPWIDEEHAFHVAAANTDVALSSDNFAVGRPAECHTIWGFNWLVRRVIPWTSGLMRDRVKEGIQQAIAEQAEKISADYGKLLEVRVTLPVDAKPIPAFYANLGVWPDSFDLTPDHLKFFVGADVEFDPDPRYGTDEAESLRLPELLDAGGRLPSYFGVARGLIEHVIREANDKGLFQFDVGRDDAPDMGDLLSAGVVALIIPDATSRFDPETPVELNFGGAASIDVVVHPDGGPGGIPIIDFCLHDFRLGLSIGGAPYYHMNLEAKVSVALGFDRRTRELKLIFQHLDVQYNGGSFAPDLTPPPTDLTFNVDFLEFFVKQLNDQLAAEGQDMISLGLPQYRLGSHEVDFLGAAFRDDYVTLDATVR